MSNYSETLSITLPVELADIAAAIGRALDPDCGGASSFVVLGDGLMISTSTPCTAEFKGQAEYLLANPAYLHAMIAQDYAARWADLTPPTLAECEAFCAGVIPSTEILNQPQG